MNSKREDTKEIYEKRYSTFTFVPGYKYELNIINRLSNILFKNHKDLKNKSLIDLGSGFGFKTYALSKKFENTIGVDISSNAVLISNTLNDNENLKFYCSDIMDFDTDVKYDYVTAFGLSNFNLPNIDELTDQIETVINKYLKETGSFILYSGTDFSGKSPTGWYNHTKKELKKLKNKLETKFYGWDIKMIFPHKSIVNYTKIGKTNLIYELVKILIKKRREYLIVISKS